MMKNQVVWLDLPVLNLERAAQFYEQVLDAPVKIEQYEQFRFAVLPHEGTNVSGCLIPSQPEDIIERGVLIYFNVTDRLSAVLAQIPKIGGEVLEAKHSIGPHGFRAIVKDSEGNRIALHSETDS
jgi:hypothetical protein